MAPSAPGAASGGGAGGGRGGGVALDFTRKKTAKAVLEIAWTFPVWKPETQAAGSNGGTTAQMARRALPLDEAYALVTDGDKRPLLVMRECERCKGTDHALLDRSLDNEQTVLLTGWFRCVKLPPNILETDHPLSLLFKPEKAGDRIPHLFFVDPDGGNKTPLPGDQSQRVLWDTMFGFLDRCYEGNAEKSIKELRKLLDQYDRIDGLESEVKARMDREIEKKGLKSNKLPKLQKDLDKLAKEREKMAAREKELRALALKALTEPALDGENAKAADEKVGGDSDN
ncbi:MAG: hypothetical protein KDE27_17470 [Planctomycetes bacterium]|nr:hypothetical protein [Planctomycetota bacterium]